MSPQCARRLCLLLYLSALVARPVPVEAQQRHPAEKKGTRSIDSQIETSITFVNQGKGTAKVFWLDYEGKRALYRVLQPGETFKVDKTYLGHPWLITDEKGNGTGLYYPDAQPRTVDLVTSPGPSVRPNAAPVSGYERRTIEGFTVFLSQELLRNKHEADEALRELQTQLKAITGALPVTPLAALRDVRIWVEWEKKKQGAAEYHPSAAWLEQNGYSLEKLRDVELCNARNFVDWSRREQPWMVLHELAHAYHFRVLGEHHAGIEAAYQQAVERGLYREVPHVSGGKRKAYALTNSREYFAELSEAYFGKNDFYPFTRADLMQHDPVGYRVLREVWGEPRQK